jgi:hypothetical protein
MCFTWLKLMVFMTKVLPLPPHIFTTDPWAEVSDIDDLAAQWQG